MRKLFIITFCLAFTGKIFSQCAPSDTVKMGAGYANDVFYSMKNKTVKTVANNNWHIAFSVQGSQFPTHPETGVSIRVNSVKGNVLVKLPGANPANWRSIDTTGLSTLPERLDSFKTWDISAFTKEYNISTAPFNFIWGAYNNTSHNVEGSSVFVLYNKTAGMYKKVFIKSLDYDTMWNVIMSNIDNTDSVYLKFHKSQFPNRLFVYYDMVNKQLNDREPAKTDWDIVWTRYKDVATVFGTTSPFNLTGILSNKGITVAKNTSLTCDKVWPGNVSAPYISETNIIGWDWKISPTGPGPYTMVDTFVYFVKTKDGKIYKLSFNNFEGQSTGNTILNGKEVTSVKSTAVAGKLSLYPNPSSGIININSDNAVLKVKITDIKGCMQTLPVNNNTIDISSLTNGVYVIQLQTKDGIYTSKIVKE